VSWIELEPGVGLEVPPDAQPVAGTPVDSTAGVLQGDGYRITYDLGRFGERLDPAQTRPREIAGRAAVEAAFAPEDEPFAWARVVQVDVDSRRTLTVRVSCDSIERCSLADRVFDSIVVSGGG
jgi:hypothetical protein